MFFLSHSSNEPEEILLGIKELLEDDEMSVYVDKYTDPNMSLVAITSQTAETLRRRMRQSSALLFVYSQYSTKSRWMPWELGFFDGLKGKVGVVTVVGNQPDKFKREEYLNLYPYVDQSTAERGSVQMLWINKQSDEYARLKAWVKGVADIKKR
jgi:TIR domain